MLIVVVAATLLFTGGTRLAGFGGLTTVAFAGAGETAELDASADTVVDGTSAGCASAGCASAGCASAGCASAGAAASLANSTTVESTGVPSTTSIGSVAIEVFTSTSCFSSISPGASIFPCPGIEAGSSSGAVREGKISISISP